MSEARKTLTTQTTPQSLGLLAAFLVIVVGAGILIGVTNLPGAWYQGLAKPPFNPPNWIFGPTWTVLYILIAIAGWRTFLRVGMGAAMQIWVVQMLLNWSWSPVSFTLHALWPAFFIIVALWLSVVAFIWRVRTADPISAALFVPYLLWVSFAGVLNLSLAILN